MISDHRFQFSNGLCWLACHAVLPDFAPRVFRGLRSLGLKEVGFGFSQLTSKLPLQGEIQLLRLVRASDVTCAPSFIASGLQLAELLTAAEPRAVSVTETDRLERTVPVHVPVPDGQELAVLVVSGLCIIHRLPVGQQQVQLQMVEVGVGR